jgi:hypothetical protein|tara:strand:- start:144 stop:554 length:411 start_codon:yes stop_codon:yes gene_type:complete
MIKQMNPIKKSLVILFLLCFTVSGYSDASNYEVGDVFESKKRTTSVVLFELKGDLLRFIRQHGGKTGSFRQMDTSYTYEVQKGDKIILLKSFKEAEGEVFRVALVPKKKSKNQDAPFYYVVPKQFYQLVFVEHLTE